MITGVGVYVLKLWLMAQHTNERTDGQELKKKKKALVVVIREVVGFIENRLVVY